MRTFNRFVITLSLTALGCGDSTTPTTTDVPATGDTGTPRAEVVPCAGLTPSATVTAPGFAFTPMSVTVTAGQTVLFDMPATHNSISDDALWNANFNTRTCVRFNRTGTFGYICGPHRFTGNVVVN